MDETERLWRRWRKALASEQPEPLEVARMAYAFERYFDVVKTEAVRAARKSGRSWDEVGDAIGTTRQSAWERYRRNERVRGSKTLKLWPAD